MFLKRSLVQLALLLIIRVSVSASLGPLGNAPDISVIPSFIISRGHEKNVIPLN